MVKVWTKSSSTPVEYPAGTVIEEGAKALIIKDGRNHVVAMVAWEKVESAEVVQPGTPPA